MTRIAKPESKARWPRRLLLAFSLLLAWTAAIQAGSFIFQARSPSLSLWFDANNPVAIVREARARIAAGTAQGNGAESAVSAARRSIEQNPLNPEAFGLYGLVTMANTDTSEISRQMLMADRLSRRDLGTQLFLIEDAVRRNDVAAALRHYDAAMRAEESVRGTLFPILADAMAQPVIRKHFLRYMNPSNPWLESFLRYAVTESSDPAAIASLVIEADGFPQSQEFFRRTQELLATLVLAGEFRSARQVFEEVGEGDPALLTAARFAPETTDPSLAPFTWQPFDHGDIDSLFVAGADGDLEFEARLGAAFVGNVVRKLFALEPGTYALAIPMRVEDFSPGDRTNWVMSCAEGDNGPIILDARLEMAPEALLRQNFTVPAGCDFQMLMLTATTSASRGNSTLMVESPILTTRKRR